MLVAGLKEQVFRQVGLFEQISTATIEAQNDIVWDIYLDYSNHYKDELRRLRPVEGEPLRRFRISALPRYVWVARAAFHKSSF